MNAPATQPRCPELIVGILYGGLTEYGREFAARDAVDPFLGEAIGRPPAASAAMSSKSFTEDMNGVNGVGSKPPAPASR